MTTTNHNVKEEPIWRSVSIFFIIFLVTFGIINVHLALFLLFIPLAIASVIAFSVAYIQRNTDLVTIFKRGPVYEQSLIDYLIGWCVLSTVSIISIYSIAFPGETVSSLIAAGIYVAILALLLLDKYTGLSNPILSRIPETRSLGLYYSLLFFSVFYLNVPVNAAFEGTASRIGSAILLLLIVALILIDAIRAR